MASQVAVAEVAVVPTFKGFRKQVDKEAEGAASTGSKGFRRVFAKTGTQSGREVGSGFKKAFDQGAKGTSDRVIKQLDAGVAKASRALSTARLKEQDAIGKVRVAQAQLNEAQEKYAKDSSQVIRAQERLKTASRQLEQAHETTEGATDDLTKAQGELARAADRAGDELSDAGTTGVEGFKSGVLGGVKSFAGPLIAAFAALGIGNIVADAFQEAKDFVLESITMASDLEQSIGGVDAIFKDQASSIHRWAEEAAQSVGLGQSKYNEMATLIGAQLKNLGSPMETLTGQTNDLVELGADLAAQFGGPTSDAVEALSSLLRGEANPIERYGVSINQAAIKARMAEDGMAGLTGEAQQQAKLQSTLSLLWEQTADAQGAFGREADTLAGKQQRNAAAWENITTTLGEGFLPVAAQLADVVGDELLPVIADLAEEYGPELGAAFAEALPALTDLAQQILPELPGLIQGFVDALPALVEFMSVVTPLIVDWMTASNDVTAILQGLFGLLTGDVSLEEFAQTLLELSGPIGDVLMWGAELLAGFWEWFTGIPEAVETGINDAVEWLEGLPERALEGLGDLGETLLQAGKDLMDGFIRGIKESPVGEAVSGVLDWVGGFFPHSPAKRGPFSGSGWTQLRRSGEATWEQYIGGMGGVGPEFPSFPSAGADLPSAGVFGGGTAVAAPGAVNQTNYFDKTDPQEAASLAKQQMAAMLRGV